MNHSIFRTAKVVLFSSVAIYFQQKLSLCYSPIFVSLQQKYYLILGDKLRLGISNCTY